MIYYLLDAYDSEIKNSMNRKFKDFKLFEKILLIVIILGAISSIVSSFLPYKTLETIVSFTYFGMIFCFTYVLNRVYKKRYKDGLEGYNKKLDKIKKLLEDEKVNINTSTKIQHLIQQYEAAIQEARESQPIVSSTKGYCYLVILPIVIYLVQHAIDKFEIEQAIQLTFVLVGILVIVFIIFFVIYSNVEPIINRKIYDMKYFKEELKDLYRRDYLE